jgi:hypothetical protein
MERTCRECGEVFSRRKAGACPYCGTKIKAYKNMWVKEYPSTALIKKYEEIVREHQEKNGEKQLLFRFPVSLLGKETKGAEALLDICQGDLDLAIQTMVYLSLSPRYADWFYQTASLWHLRSSYVRVVGRVKQLMDEKGTQQERQRKELEQLEKRYGDLF